MQVEIPDTPLAALRAVIHILAHHRIEIGLLKIEPAALYELINDCKGWEIGLNYAGERDTIMGILFEQKRP